jgi:hypothetical protein
MITWHSKRPPGGDDFGDLLPASSDWFLGLDLGQQRDPSALVAVERTRRPDAAPLYTCRALHRWPLGQLYSQVVLDIAGRLDMRLPQSCAQPLHGSTLVIDGTGAGRPVVEMFRRASLPCKIVALSITSGISVSLDAASGFYHVPKRELVSTLAALLHSGRLKIVPTLPDAEVLTRELETFKVKVTTAGNETFEAWRERDHDDLVLALAIACWYAERCPPDVGDFPPWTDSDEPPALPGFQMLERDIPQSPGRSTSLD